MTYPREKQFGTVTGVSDMAANGVIPINAPLMDGLSLITLAQATAGILATLPIPSITNEQKSVTVINTGTVSVNVNGIDIAAKGKANFVFYSGTWY